MRFDAIAASNIYREAGVQQLEFAVACGKKVPPKQVKHVQ